MPRARREVDPERAERERIRQRFKKRKKGLQKKARELCDMCGADITILLRSSTQKLYQFSSSTFFSFVEEFLREPEKVVDLTTGKLMTGQSLPEDFLEGELVAGGGHASSGGGGATPSRQYALRARRRRPATRMHLDQEEEEEDEEEEDAGVQGDDDEEYVPAGVVRNAAVLHAMSHARPALTGVELSSATAAVLARRRAAAALSSSPSSSSVKEEEVEQQEKQPQGEAVEEDFQSPSTWFNGPSMLETQQQQQQQQQQKTRWGVAPLSMPSMVEGSGSSRQDAGAASLDPRTPQSAMSMHTALTVGTINTVTPFGSSAFPSAGRGAMLDQQQHQHQQQQQQQQHQQQLDFQTPTPFRDHQSPCGLFQDNSPRTAFSCSPMAR